MSKIAQTNNKMMSSVLSNRMAWEKCTHLYGETKGNNETQTLSTENCLRQVQKKEAKKKKKKKKGVKQNKNNDNNKECIRKFPNEN